MNILKRKPKSKQEYGYNTGTTLQDVMACKLKGHHITIRYRWDWNFNTSEVKGERVQIIFCETCYFKKYNTH